MPYRALTLLAATSVGCLALAGAGASGAPDGAAAPLTPGAEPVRAQAARVLAVNDKAYLHLANPNSASSTLVEEGQATGTLPGKVRARLSVGTSTVRASFTIYLKGGSISGRGTTQLNAGKGEYASFGGSLKVTGGTGHYAHTTGSGGLYGTINRTTDNAVVQVVGRLHV